MPQSRPLARPATTQSSRGALTILFATVFVDLLGFGIVIPFLPLYAARLQVRALGIGLILSSYSLTQLISAPLLGSLSDRYGRRPVIILGLLGSSVSYVIYGLANSFLVLLASRAVHGACAGTVATAQAYVADVTSDAERAHGMGLIGAAFGLGFVLGPAVGGLLGHADLRVPVFFAAAITFLNFVCAATVLPETHRKAASPQRGWRAMSSPLLSLPRQLARHRLWRLFATVLLLTSAMAGFEATFAVMVAAVYGYSAREIGELLAFAGLLQALTQGYLLRKMVARQGEIKLIRAGILLFAAGMAPMANWPNRQLLWLLIGMLSVGYGLASPSLASLISLSTPAQLQGEILGINQSAQSLARICGPIFAGFVYQTFAPGRVYVA